MNKTLIHLIAYPGVGKLTIAKELKEEVNAYLVDNHIINNVFFSVTDLDKQLPPQVFAFLNKGYELLFEYIKTLDMERPLILTNCLVKSENDAAFVKRLQRLCSEIGYRYLPVKLTLSEDELLKRLASPERKAKMKLTDPALFKRFFPQGSIIEDVENMIEINITGYSVKDSVAAIKQYLL